MVVAVKALACELPSRLGMPFSRLQVPDIVTEVVTRGIAADISGTTIWRWLSEDAIRPWRSRSWIVIRDRSAGPAAPQPARRVASEPLPSPSLARRSLARPP
ncbi:MAG: hypothetical protein LC808_18710 [Actinobacteria bacterium]|nr:hypothetical protein [Actinomycetota bacterium]